MSTKMPLAFVLLQVTFFMVEIWILDYSWGKNQRPESQFLSSILIL